MAEYIDRASLINNLKTFAPEHFTPLINDLILKEPAADVVERRKGKWLQLGKCSECGGSAPFWSMASTYYESDFCPHCGADMR